MKPADMTAEEIALRDSIALEVLKILLAESHSSHPRYMLPDEAYSLANDMINKRRK